jgi:hypothetical protein
VGGLLAFLGTLWGLPSIKHETEGAMMGNSFDYDDADINSAKAWLGEA